MNLKISVIIPVYNAEKTLHRCVDSILVQTLSDFEVLLIDDGCKDNSGKICDEYAKKDSRVKVIHKVNGGVSSARNMGLDNAKGEWITFIDADDYIASDFLSAINNNDCDFIIGQSQHFNSSGKYWYSERLSPQKFLSEEEKREFLEHNLLWHIMRTPWGKFFKRDLITEIRFDDGMKIGEDTVFVHDYLLHCKSIAVVDNITYYYFDSEDNVSIKYSMSPLESLDHLKKIIEHYRKLNVKSPQFEFFEFRFFLSLCQDLMEGKSKLWFGDNFITNLIFSFRKVMGKKDFLKLILMKIPWLYNLKMQDYYSNIKVGKK